jgi:hypothetical protein
MIMAVYRKIEKDKEDFIGPGCLGFFIQGGPSQDIWVICHYSLGFNAC